VTVRYGAVDVHYPDDGGARAALVVAADPRFGTVVEERVAFVDAVPAYRAGFFFERELAGDPRRPGRHGAGRPARGG